MPKLAGEWQLNKDLSDDPRQKMQQARADSSGGQTIPTDMEEVAIRVAKTAKAAGKVAG